MLVSMIVFCCCFFFFVVFLFFVAFFLFVLFYYYYYYFPFLSKFKDIGKMRPKVVPITNDFIAPT